MKRKIIVTINADEKTCGGCDWHCGYTCYLFDRDIKANRAGHDARLAACLAAEKKARGGK